MKTTLFPIVVECMEEGGYYAECPLLEECDVEGDTYVEVIENINDIGLSVEEFRGLA